jgi:uncharacterized protein
MRRIDELIEVFKKKEGILVAFSGGVDSSVVAYLAFKALGDRSLAVTIDSEVMPALELRDAVTIASHIGIRHIIVREDMLSNEDFVKNPKERCYICKKNTSLLLKSEAQKYGFPVIADGTNADDMNDFRPGMKAWHEEGFWSPLLELGLGKKDTREIAREVGLSIWDKSSAACLASRIPYGKRITAETLSHIEKSEAFLKSLGFKQVRVRDYGDLARIETDDVAKAMGLRKEILSELKKYYKFVTIDLEGYRTGSLNVVL